MSCTCLCHRDGFRHASPCCGSLPTDLEVVKSIFDARKIGYRILTPHDVSELYPPDNMTLRFSYGDAKFDGYGGFCGELRFDNDGALIGTGAWE